MQYVKQWQMHAKLFNCSAIGWFVESMAEYLTHDGQTVAGGVAEAVVMHLVTYA